MVTDNEIIKAYEGLSSRQQLNLFRNLHYTDGNATENGIISNAINDILPQFNRQKAEIERLYIALEENQKATRIWKDIAHRETSYVEKAKTEAIKKFAEALKDRIIHNDEIVNRDSFVITNEINNLVKEKVGKE